MKPAIEPLEGRCLCATSVLYDPGHDVVTILGDNTDNTVDVRETNKGRRIQVFADGNRHIFKARDVDRLRFRGFGGDDRFVNRVRRDRPDWEVHAIALNGYNTSDQILELRRIRDAGYEVDVVVLVFCHNDIDTYIPEYQKLYGEPPSPERQAILGRNREMAVRLCWKPYMYNPHLPHLLEQVRIPSLVIFGRNDALVPVICGEQYHNALAGSTLKIIDNCGHVPQMEKPEEFLTSAIGFMKGI